MKNHYSHKVYSQWILILCTIWKCECIYHRRLLIFLYFSHAVILIKSEMFFYWHFTPHSYTDGKCMACTYRVKFIEVSVGINHNVDELLAGTLTQIRLKKEHCELQVRQTKGNERHLAVSFMSKALNLWHEKFSHMSLKFCQVQCSINIWKLIKCIEDASRHFGRTW